MAISLACPDPQELERLVRGQLSEAEADQVGRHILSCSHCAHLLNGLQASDPLLTDLQAAVHQPLDNSSVEELMQRLLGARPDDGPVPAREAARPAPTESTPPPQHIGRYRIERLLGEGSFGRVFLGHDDELKRPVAIKIPRQDRVSRPQDIETYRAEAQTLASMDHAHIVPVYDVGRTEDGLCFVVSKFIKGNDLATVLKGKRLDHGEAAELVATVAEALHHAHRHGLVHRDVKPSNILMDTSGQPYVADFGLALKEEDFGKGATLAGTPAYMSPEQARGEGHRVDGRSDIFSLGLVFYEILAGRRPFQSENPSELLEQISRVEVRPPRQVDDTIPKELERICLKALAKKASDRYTTARDMAEDLRHFLAAVPAENQSTVTAQRKQEAELALPLPGPAATRSDQQALKIVPKGLRSFDATDADFFLELLPGPRDREGLPDSIRFWKTRIEGNDADHTFSVGLIYGPSGCGKSSLVKAGLLPRLAKSVVTVYVEATGEETEVRLLKGLRRQVQGLPSRLGLVEALALLRQGRYLEAGQKVLLVLDQFEQWLHAKSNDDHTELVQALRQCDGSRVQCLVLVRDDFGMAATRFMAALDIPILQGNNFATVDLFDLLHARKVLAAFGRAYGRLPENLSQCTRNQHVFLDQVIAGLAQDGKVISVRLALFAEMVKGKPWTPGTLKQVGGTAGVGVIFLEETFTALTAPPQHRLHQKAAQAVLNALLPQGSTDIKGHMRSREELLQASGYVNRPKDFDDLLRILDSELRLITPTDPELSEPGASATGWSAPVADAPGSESERYYQLTHDYLVPALRDGLTRNKKETRRGRSELLLADRAALWQAKRENRHLPAWWEWLNIRLFTRKRDWTPAQQELMRKANRYHAVRGVILAVLLAAVTLTGLLIRDRVIEENQATHAAGLVRRLLDAEPAQVPDIVTDMEAYRRWTDPLLREAYAEADKGRRAATKETERTRYARRQLHASLGLGPVDPDQVPYLYRRLLGAQAHEVAVIRDALQGHKEELLERLWAVAQQPAKGQQSQRLRAASALAKFDPESKRWAKAQNQIANDLVRVPAVHLATWMEALRPVRSKLRTPLAAVFRDPKRQDSERSLATDILADYAADQPDVLVNLLMDADVKQFAFLYPKLEVHRERVLPVLKKTLATALDSKRSERDKEKLAKRQANAAVALLKMNQLAKAWRLLKHSSDPRARSYLIHRLGPLGADAGLLVQRLQEEPDVTIRRALILSLGPEEFGKEAWTPAAKKRLVQQLQQMYRTAADPGLHGAAEWLLRQWHMDQWLEQTDAAWAKDKAQRRQRLDRVKQQLANPGRKPARAQPQWYVTGQGHTMVVAPGPLIVRMGSPLTEEGRFDNERQHRKRIGRTFAIAAKPVTVKQFQQFYRRVYKADYVYLKHYAPTNDCPVHWISWYMAAQYCNWLSDQEGLSEKEWCYEPNKEHKYGPGMKLKPAYLGLTGYRLPTEAEWEYACRADARTSRYYGESEELLPKYGWFLQNAKNRSWPVAGKKPNDLGVFDMHGNGWCWCQEEYKEYPQGQGDKPKDDTEDILSINIQNGRVLRSGAFLRQPVYVRSAYRVYYGPAYRDDAVGFRPARTFTP